MRLTGGRGFHATICRRCGIVATSHGCRAGCLGMNLAWVVGSIGGLTVIAIVRRLLLLVGNNGRNAG